MKRYILLTLLIIGQTVYANTYEYTQMNSMDGFEAMFELINPNSKSHSVILDCQSFFHKLDFYDSSGQLTEENYITFGECEYLYENFNKCLQTEKVKCIDNQDLFNPDCICK